jgi:hypothetical protein
MAQADFEFQLFDGEPAGESVIYRPGDTLQGRVLIFTDNDIKCKHLYLRLLWHTEGRGTRYEEIIEETDVFQGTLKSGFPSTYDFSFTLPNDPWSYEGHYVSVVWRVQADLDIPWGKDIKGSKAFILQPNRVSE